MANRILGIVLAIVAAFAVGGIALQRNEPINALWIVVAAVCIYTLGYRFYAAWISAKVLSADATRATPAERLNNGRDFVPTHRWVVFGHHFAAIAGPGPLVGPTLAAQFGYLPGTLWLLVGSVLGGCVQDMIILFLSTRRNGKSLGQMARDELGPYGGFAALIGTLMIMVILIAVLGLVVVNAMKHSPWATSTVAATIPIAIFIGFFLRRIRPGRVLEGSVLGVALLLLAVWGGGLIDHNQALRGYFDHAGTPLAMAVIVYGWLAAIVPVWLLLAPRDYLSTFLKLGVVGLLAIAILLMHPTLKMPALTQFVDGTGPLFSGKVFPFVFITIACGAISGFHALVSSGTTPKLITNEADIRLAGYGSMALESFVGIMAMIAATLLDPGVYFAINTGAGVVGAAATDAVATISSWGFPVSVEQMQDLAKEMGESTLFARTGGAPSLAVGMASIFGTSFGRSLMSVWYHFAIMFEAVFILTTVDAGTRVGRFMVQDLLGQVWKPMARTSWYPSIIISSTVIVAGWGYFLYIGVIDPNGGINILWPLFGISNQMLASIALSIATGIIIKKGKVRYAFVTALPLAWLALVTTVAAWQKVFSTDPKLGFFAGADDLAAKLASGLLPADRIASAPQLIFNQNLDGWLTVFFTLVLWFVIGDMLRIAYCRLTGRAMPASSEAPYTPTQLNGVNGAAVGAAHA
ncbi:MAG TPA: carbon starvation CstA family protein [Steroidobacteraceae bacterium]|jgi:carbon starvation protein|nr:carbon starvation CstA family protein [Steroidobacteraceae bacterium]